MKILATSDLHGCLPRRVPKCDLLLIAGDICPFGDHSIESQFQWLNRDFRSWLDYTHDNAQSIVFIAGNHDLIFEREPMIVEELNLPAIYLRDELCTSKGLSIYGIPWVSPCWGAFILSKEKLKAKFDQIPKGVDIVLSHGPARGHCDVSMGRIITATGEIRPEHAGSKCATDMLNRVRPKAFIHGHIHEGFGKDRHKPNHGDMIDIYNVAYLDPFEVPRAFVRIDWDVDIKSNAIEVPPDEQREVHSPDTNVRLAQEQTA